MNTRRILLGGLVAGLVMNVLDALTNAVLFGPAWEKAYSALGLSSKNPAIPMFWTVFDFVAGVLIAWLYAAMRPRFGPGPRTAIYAALVEWLILHLALYSHLADQVFPAGVILGASACELVSALAGGLIAGRLYQERAPAAA